MALIECIPNVSEGRRADVIGRLADRVGRPRTIQASYAPEMAALVQGLRMRIAEARSQEDSSEHAPEIAA